LSFIIWVGPHIVSLTTPVSDFCSPGVWATIETVARSTAVARTRMAFAENIIFIFLSPYFEMTA
jgi:hypothetical protein